MSIDFATLQGLSIPEGVVTKIEDAAGNVLWESNREVVLATWYLRPSADVSVEKEGSETITYFPEGSTSPYLLINEEVSDETSTYVDVKESGSTSGADVTFSFVFSGNVEKKKIVDAKLNLVAREGGNATKSFTASVSFQGVTYGSLVTVDSNPSYAKIDSATYKTFSVPLDAGDFVAALNTYVAANGAGVLSMNVSIRLCVSEESQGTTSKTDTISFTQAYLEITYES